MLFGTLSGGAKMKKFVSQVDVSCSAVYGAWKMGFRSMDFTETSCIFGYDQLHVHMKHYYLPHQRQKGWEWDGERPEDKMKPLLAASI